MAYRADIIADSLSPHGDRLTTWLLEYPMIVHAEHLRHREQSFCVASSRAIPSERVIQKVREDPFIPERWPINRPGMQATEYAEWPATEFFTRDWLGDRDRALESARFFSGNGVHKQIANRLLHPWMWVTVVCSATSFSNFFALRCHPAAQPEIRRVAVMMLHRYYAHCPDDVAVGDWHLPFVTAEEKSLWSARDCRRFAATRCARTSYLNHENCYAPEADFKLADRLMSGVPPHASPFEHVATPMDVPGPCRNFYGWRQMRTEIDGDTTQSFDYAKWIDEYGSEDWAS